MKNQPVKVFVKMRGNFAQYENEKVYEVDEAEAVKLLSLGYATKVDAPEQAKE